MPECERHGVHRYLLAAVPPGPAGGRADPADSGGLPELRQGAAVRGGARGSRLDARELRAAAMKSSRSGHDEAPGRSAVRNAKEDQK